MAIIAWLRLPIVAYHRPPIMFDWGQTWILYRTTSSFFDRENQGLCGLIAMNIWNNCNRLTLIPMTVKLFESTLIQRKELLPALIQIFYWRWATKTPKANCINVDDESPKADNAAFWLDTIQSDINVDWIHFHFRLVSLSVRSCELQWHTVRYRCTNMMDHW